jgi:alanine-glyoxylate transaminase/serine-glyoxylate transaminase/serine-pyruvate transaminase
MTRPVGMQFLQIPGPTNVPERVARALARPLIDHRGAEFAALARETLAGVAEVFRTEQPVALFPSSGTGAWEAALVNTLSPGDKVLACENGHFAAQWARLAERLGLDVVRLSGDWRRAPDPDLVMEALSADPAHDLKAVLLVHNETSTGVTASVPEVRKAIDHAGHPALLLVDTISSLGSIDYRHDEWGVDVSIGCSQKGLMLPPGIGLNAIGEKALAASVDARSPRAYWDWRPALEAARTGMFPYTPPTSLIFALHEALRLLAEEGLDVVLARHSRHAAATQAAIEAWGFEVYAADPSERSASLTAALVPDGSDADALREHVQSHYGLSLGGGLELLKGRVFRIGHLGDFNDLMLCATLAGVELGLAATIAPDAAGGVTAALATLGRPVAPVPQAVSGS